MAHIIRSFHPFCAHFGKDANATFVNPRNWQEWTCADLVEQITSPWCTTWCGGLIWSGDHAHKSWGQAEKVGSTKLFKFDSSQRGFWGDLVLLSCSPRHEAWQDHPICHKWHARIFMESLENISCVNISKAWNIHKGFWRVWPIFWTWPCVETLIYGQYMSTEFPWIFTNIFKALKIILTY